ncbi:hypothetical protein ACFVH0_26280 [Streptomyces sp. NPDC127117]|uniref:hypothetical protein n=1 Tax=Streptomyces sp. NPDC127117 TaxID=3345368 RepID=UPI0036380F38
MCITQITSWGIVCRPFPVRAPTITADTGRPTGATAAAFSAALDHAAVGIRINAVCPRIDRRRDDP